MRRICSILIFLTTSIVHGQSLQPLNTVDIKLIDDKRIALVHQQAKQVQIQSTDGVLLNQFDLEDFPTGLAVKGNKLYVTTSHSLGRLLVIDLATSKVCGEYVLGMGARSPVLSRNGERVYVCCQYANRVTEINLLTGKMKSIEALREPYNCLLAEDDTKLFVSNFLPNGKANADLVTSKITLIDTRSFSLARHIPLTNGSNALRGMCLSPDEKYLFITHNLGRFQVPTSQIRQGWMNTSAISVIKVQDNSFEGSFLTDLPERGCAGVWDIQCNEKWMFVSHSGIHQISRIDYPKMLERLEQKQNKDELAYDLRFLKGIRELFPVVGNGPRVMALGERDLFIVTYFSDTLNTYNLNSRQLSAQALNPGYHESIERKGEKIFNDATYCFQSWQSCNGCHPGQARTDGLNWDLLNDGIGNPKNCKSLLKSHVTAPSMITGIRPDAETAVRAGFIHIQFTSVPEKAAEAVDAYLRSLEPMESPYRVDGELSKAAKKGRVVFQKAACDRCHSGAYFTDLKMHPIGKTEFEKGWDTPTLIEIWRTAPYLHDGSAENLEELFSENRHGLKNHPLNRKKIKYLVEYMNSL